MFYQTNLTLKGKHKGYCIEAMKTSLSLLLILKP